MEGKSMKIYISADIEGISGVVKGSQTTETGHDYERARRLMTEATLFIPGVELIEANKIRHKAKDIVEAYKMRAGLTTLAASTLK